MGNPGSVLITGGGSGIGKHLSLTLAKRGCKVTVSRPHARKNVGKASPAVWPLADRFYLTGRLTLCRLLTWTWHQHNTW